MNELDDRSLSGQPVRSHPLAHLPGLMGQRGQTMAEYAVVLAVITLAIIVALTALRTGIIGTLGSVTGKL